MKYRGNCHCKKVLYEVDLELESIISCNCSHCQIKGMLLVFVPGEKFTLQSGNNDITKYLFNKKVIDHYFCKHCGVESFANGKDKDGNDTVVINVRCLEGIDIDTLPITKFDGKSW